MHIFPGPADLPGISRRDLLRLTGGLALAAALPMLATPAFAADAYDTLRARWIEQITGGALDAADPFFASAFAALDAEAQAQYTSMDKTAGRTALWPDLPVSAAHPSANITASASRIKKIAVAYATPGAAFYADTTVATVLASAIAWLNSTIYNTSQPPAGFGNSYDWVIGTPANLTDSACLIYSSLTAGQLANLAAAIDHFIPDVAAANMPSGFGNIGANRTDICQVVIIRGILTKTSAKISAAVTALSAVFPQVRSGDGFYPDGSFIQHTWVPYTGSYGLVVLSGLARLFALLTGSTWAVTDPARQNIFDSVESSYAPFVYNGLIMAGVQGRGISNAWSDEHTRGHALTATILQLAAGASSAEAAAWRRTAKGWINRAYWKPYQTDLSLSLPQRAIIKAVIDDTAITPAPEPVGHRVFGSMDRAVHRRPTWAFTVSMCSSRTSFYETGNGANLRGWHTNSGMTYWWGSTYGHGQYDDAFWPTIDPYRLPGVTVSRKLLADAAGGAWNATRPNNVSWTGGATDGQYAALGQHTTGLLSTLQARKSWFCLDDSVVCLGAGITATDGAAVETTVDNRNLGPAGTHAFVVNGAAKPTTTGYSETVTGAQWAHLAGFGGYTFPGGAVLKAKREARTGRWRDIDTTGPTDNITRVYLTMWLDHGVDPTAGAYSYLLLPGADAATTAARAAAPTASVLANTTTVQAVSDTATGVTAANFYTAGQAGPITVSAPCSVLMRESGGTLTISVADPTRTATTITVTVARTGFTTASSDPQVNVIGLAPITLLVESGGTHGASHSITFGAGSAITAGTPTNLTPTADAHVRDGGYAPTNYGNQTLLEIKNAGAGYARRSFVKFDLTTLAAAPRRAVLWVYGESADSTGTQAEVAAYAVSADSWTETGLTWNNQPALGTLQATAAIGDAKDWIPLDVTAHIAAQHAGDRTATIGLAEPAPGVAVQLHSRNHADHRPYLQIITG